MTVVHWRIQKCFKRKSGDESFGLLKAGGTAQTAHRVAWLSQKEKTKAQWKMDTIMTDQLQRGSEHQHPSRLHYTLE